jgi:glutaredoxin
MASANVTDSGATRPRKIWWPLFAGICALAVITKYAATPNIPAVFCDVDADPANVDAMMLSASWCRYCARARHFFVARGHRYCEYDIELSPTGARLYRESGVQGVPVIFIGDDVIVGFNRHEIGQSLVAAGALDVEQL